MYIQAWKENRSARGMRNSWKCLQCGRIHHQCGVSSPGLRTAAAPSQEAPPEASSQGALVLPGSACSAPAPSSLPSLRAPPRSCWVNAAGRWKVLCELSLCESPSVTWPRAPVCYPYPPLLVLHDLQFGVIFRFQCALGSFLSFFFFQKFFTFSDLPSVSLFYTHYTFIFLIFFTVSMGSQGEGCIYLETEIFYLRLR